MKDGEWGDDPLIMDERRADNNNNDDDDDDDPGPRPPESFCGRYLAAKIKDGGLVIFSASSYAGIVNVCKVTQPCPVTVAFMVH